MGFQGGYGSSSLKECIELLNATAESAPAPLDSGVGQKSTDPPHFDTAKAKTRMITGLVAKNWPLNMPKNGNFHVLGISALAFCSKKNVATFGPFVYNPLGHICTTGTTNPATHAPPSQTHFIVFLYFVNLVRQIAGHNSEVLGFDDNTRAEITKID